FQAEDGIRDFHVTGVQTCALPIWRPGATGPRLAGALGMQDHERAQLARDSGQGLGSGQAGLRRADRALSSLYGRLGRRDLAEPEIGRASCRERVESEVVSAARVAV